MNKKLILTIVLVCFSFGFAQAETMIFGGGQLAICNQGEVRGGTLLGLGQRVSKQVILWGNLSKQKTDPGLTQYLMGLSILSEYLIPNINMGGYLQAEGGWNKEIGEPTVEGGLVSLGLFFDANEKNTLWLGWGYNGIHSIQAGLSIDVTWR